MRGRTLIAAALMAGFWVAARSKPTSETGSSKDRDATSSTSGSLGDRVSDGAVVSRLEAGHDPELAFARPIDRPSAPRVVRRSGRPASGTADALARHDHAAAPAPEVSVTTTSTLTTPLEVASAPLPVAAGPGDGASSVGDGAEPGPAADPRGPVIIIRGGAGTPHDDCAIHGRGVRGGGIAVNNRMPPLAGGVLRSDRGYGSGSWNPGAFRGRIR